MLNTVCIKTKSIVQLVHGEHGSISAVKLELLSKRFTFAPSDAIYYIYY